MKTAAVRVSPLFSILAFFAGLHTAYAQELEGGFTEAASTLKRYVKAGIGAAAIICCAVCICIVAWKLMTKEPGAVGHLVAFGAGAVLFGVARALM